MKKRVNKKKTKKLENFFIIASRFLFFDGFCDISEQIFNENFKNSGNTKSNYNLTEVEISLIPDEISVKKPEIF